MTSPITALCLLSVIATLETVNQPKDTQSRERRVGQQQLATRRAIQQQSKRVKPPRGNRTKQR